MIEKSFGILKRRFPALKTGIRLKEVSSILDLITCSFVFHNIAQSRGDIFEENDESDLIIDDGDELNQGIDDSQGFEGAVIRDRIADLF